MCCERIRSAVSSLHDTHSQTQTYIRFTQPQLLSVVNAYLWKMSHEYNYNTLTLKVMYSQASEAITVVYCMQQFVNCGVCQKLPGKDLQDNPGHQINQ